MPIDDEAAARYYEDPSHLVARGPGRRRTAPVLSAHVPIRFRPETIAKVKILADRAGQTVSSWIRQLVEEEISRQMPDTSETRSSARFQFSMRVRNGQSETITSNRLRAV